VGCNKDSGEEVMNDCCQKCGNNQNILQVKFGSILLGMLCSQCNLDFTLANLCYETVISERMLITFKEFVSSVVETEKLKKK
jgi:hypothetical protein